MISNVIRVGLAEESWLGVARPEHDAGDAEMNGGIEMSCPCSIFDVREEQILETSGALRVRLVCNVCGKMIDSKVVDRGGEATERVAGVMHHPPGDGDGVVVHSVR